MFIFKLKTTLGGKWVKCGGFDGRRKTIQVQMENEGGFKFKKREEGERSQSVGPISNPNCDSLF